MNSSGDIYFVSSSNEVNHGKANVTIPNSASLAWRIIPGPHHCATNEGLATGRKTHQHQDHSFAWNHLAIDPGPRANLLWDELSKLQMVRNLPWNLQKRFTFNTKPIFQATSNTSLTAYLTRYQIKSMSEGSNDADFFLCALSCQFSARATAVPYLLMFAYVSATAKLAIAAFSHVVAKVEKIISVKLWGYTRGRNPGTCVSQPLLARIVPFFRNQNMDLSAARVSEKPAAGYGRWAGAALQLNSIVSLENCGEACQQGRAYKSSM